MAWTLITGGATRLGREIALAFTQAGWGVACHYRHSQDAAQQLCESIRAQGGCALSVAGDLEDEASCRQLFEATVRETGTELRCVVNNASLFEPDEVGTITKASWAEHLDTNLRAPVFLSQAFARQLPDGEEGNVISIIDQRVWKLNPKFFSYTTSKSGLWTATRTLAQALAPRIRVNAIGPGPALPSVRMDQAEFDKQAKLTLLGRGTSPEEISAAVKFILSQPSLTGQMIALDGGQHLVWQTPDVVEVNE